MTVAIYLKISNGLVVDVVVRRGEMEKVENENSIGCNSRCEMKCNRSAGFVFRTFMALTSARGEIAWRCR